NSCKPSTCTLRFAACAISLSCFAIIFRLICASENFSGDHSQRAWIKPQRTTRGMAHPLWRIRASLLRGSACDKSKRLRVVRTRIRSARHGLRLYNRGGRIMRRLFRCFLSAMLRVFRCCGTQAQAVAYNMFLAFFPMLVLALSVASGAVGLRGANQEVALRLRALLPPGSRQMVHDFLTQQAGHPWPWTVF